MSFKWPDVLAQADANGTAVTGTTATTLLPITAVHTFRANELRLNQRFRLRASGRMSNIVTTPGTLTMDLRMAGVIASTGPAWQLNAVAKTDVPWWLDLDFAIKAIGDGTTANLLGIGKWTCESVVGSPLPSVGGAGVLTWPASAPAVGTGFNSAAAVTCDLFAKFSLSGNSIQLHHYTLERLGG